MKTILKIAGLIALMVLTSTTFSQTNEIQIKFIGNCGLWMSDGSHNIYLDFPYKSGVYRCMEYDLSEIDSIKSNPIFIYTHLHADHYSGRLVKELAKKLNGRIYTPLHLHKLSTLNHELKDFSIEAFKTKHKYSINHYSYLITWHNKRILISGDTEKSETICGLKDLDCAFIPFWILLDANDKGIKLLNLGKMFPIYHISPRYHITKDPNDTKILLLDKPGKIITIPY